METVLVQHRRRARRTDVPDGPDSDPGVRGRAYWSLWRHRHFPWAALDDGVRVLLLESWSSGGRLTWLVEARDVLRATVSSQDEVVDTVAAWAGESADDVARSDYLVASSVESGLVLGFRAQPVTWLGLERPADLRLDRNGWALARVDELAEWGVELPERETTTLDT
ncbi:hypothetical protein [Mumia sp.]|uniref:hypothetical protein n=1 Tax=Mumia sp. TaxID=1965300 RepID=UPI002611FD06|nr:hypothetical protein [Mumia sp.]MDD9348548.1 hypothetical protein [Mumia sp.]